MPKENVNSSAKEKSQQDQGDPTPQRRRANPKGSEETQTKAVAAGQPPQQSPRPPWSMSPYTPQAIRSALAQPPADVPVVTRRMLRRNSQGHLLPRPVPPTAAPPPRTAAVLLPFYPGKSGLHLVFTRRADHLPEHRGQISFPGGGVEPEDGSLEVTALREFTEELGVPGELVTIWGRLKPVYVPPSHFTIHPFVGYLAQRPKFKPAPAEVAEILEIPLALLAGPGCFGYRTIEVDGEPQFEPGFAWHDNWIWGATAIILDQLLAHLTPPPHQPSRD